MNTFLSSNFYLSILPDLDKRSKVVEFSRIGLIMAKKELLHKPISINIEPKMAAVLTRTLGVQVAPSSEFETVKSGDLLIIAKYFGPDIRGQDMPKGGRFEFYSARIT